jgi:hypothetical protein
VSRAPAELSAARNCRRTGAAAALPVNLQERKCLTTKAIAAGRGVVAIPPIANASAATQRQWAAVVRLRSGDNMAGQARVIVRDGEIAVSDDRGRTPSPGAGLVRARTATRLAGPRIGPGRRETPIGRRTATTSTANAAFARSIGASASYQRGWRAPRWWTRSSRRSWTRRRASWPM